jgi:hypothetical protein
MMRVTAWAAGLIILGGLFGLSVVSGSALPWLAAALLGVALLCARVIMLNGPAELRALVTDVVRSLDEVLARVGRERTPQPRPVAAGVDREGEWSVSANSRSAGIRRFDVSLLARRTFTALDAVDAAPAANDGALTLRQKIAVVAALVAFGAPLALRLFRLADFQAEPYGDINIVFESVQEVLRGDWPFRFTLSSGPLYHYLIAPLVTLFGFDYLGIKLASVVVSLPVLWFVYAFGRSAVGHAFGLLGVFIAGVSSWLLIFSRLGNSQIVVPLLVMAALWAAVQFLRTGRTAYVVACAAVSALGLYGYPQSFVIAPTMLATLLVLKVCGHVVSWRALGQFGLTFALLALPFVLLLAEDAGNITGPYIFSKIEGVENPLASLATNFVSSMAAFHVKGDSVFRSNPVDQPHLDVWSGLFMLAGIVFWLRRDLRRWFPLLFVPFLLLQSASMLVVNFQAEVPSASRTLGVAPIAYLWAASGVWWMAVELRRRLPRAGTFAASAVVGVALVLITQANVQRYFVDYGDGLPYGNTPIARTAVNYLDTLPAETNVYLFHCCWEGSMPEPLSIQFDMRTPRRLVEITERTLTCDMLDAQITRPAVLLWDFHYPLPDPNLQACAQRLPAQLHVAPNGKPAFYAAVVQP